MEGFTHFDAQGSAVMVDVSEKDVTCRMAEAEGRIFVSKTCYGLIMAGTVKKGDVLGTARIAGIMGAKKTSELIPLCHPLALTTVSVDFVPEPDTCSIHCICRVKCTGRTGVEMEALTGVSAALLTVYDMCKAVDRGMEISDVRLLHKEGGKSGVYDRTGERNREESRDREGDDQ